MRGRPSCLLQSARGEANRILLASALSSMRIICPNRVSRRDWIIAVSLGCFVSLRTSSFRTNWYHLMPSSIRRHHWSSASILRASVLDIALEVLCNALYKFKTYLLTYKKPKQQLMKTLNIQKTKRNKPKAWFRSPFMPEKGTGLFYSSQSLHRVPTTQFLLADDLYCHCNHSNVRHRN